MTWKWTNWLFIYHKQRKDDQDENRQELLKEDKAMMKKLVASIKTSFN
jgi:hypothetical protein